MFRFMLFPVLFLASVISLTSTAWAQGRTIGFEETFALAKDRKAAIAQLIPGTADFYYYSCLERQHAGKLEDVPPLLETWIERHGRTRRVEEIENRQALLSFARDPGKTYAFLIRRLGLEFNHERKLPGARPDLPTHLDGAALSTAALTRRALEKHKNSLAGFRASALRGLATTRLGPVLLRDLLSRLRRPDVPNLPSLVVRDLEAKRSRGFGSLRIHRALMLDQLDECARLRPELLDDEDFISAYIIRLRPSDDVNGHDPRVREAYLDRLEAFTDRLSSSQNSLKAHVLHHRLKFDLSRDEVDRTRFMKYLRLPRKASWMPRERLKNRRPNDALVDPRASFPTKLETIEREEDLIRACFRHIFATADSFEPFAKYVRRSYLKRLFAETKILAGVGDKERWYSMLDDPSYYEALRERVEISFPPTNKVYFSGDEPVALDVDIKNVDTLLVKVFEINALNYYLEKHEEVDASIRLEGLVASQEKAHAYDNGPFVRIRRRFEFPSLSRPGVFVIEFIGNGLSSRAVIRKGRLRYTQENGPAGHILRVFDENGDPLPNASVYLGAREYVADAKGRIQIPYSTRPGTKTIILRHGDRATLESFRHAGEFYSLRASIFMERESLLAGAEATVVIRPLLTLNGETLDPALLEDPVLTISSKNIEGTTTSWEIRDLKLAADRDTIKSIVVPEGAVFISAHLRGKVESLTTGKPVKLSSSTAGFPINRIDETLDTESPLLGRTPEGYVLDVLGKNGEPVVDRALEIRLTHEDFVDPIDVSLKTDSHGRIHLGPLPGITALRTSGFPKGVGGWSLDRTKRRYPYVIHAQAGTTVRIPYMGQTTTPSWKDISLIAMRGDKYYRNAFEHVAIQDGFVELKGLEPGNYEFASKDSGHVITIRVASGPARAGRILGETRTLELDPRDPIHITDMRRDGDDIVIRCANANDATRVHVFGTRFLPAYDPYASLVVFAPPALEVSRVTGFDSIYASGRAIGDEYRYILDRRGAKKFPGNMLGRPGILLNPWALEETRSVIGLGGGAGGRYGGRKGGRRRGRGGHGAPSAPGGASPGSFPNLDFLPEAAHVVTNLRPDENGLVRVALSEIGPGQLIHAVAVDERETVHAEIVLPEKPMKPRDRRLPKSLDVTKHYAETRSIEFVNVGDSATILRAAGSAVESYDSLSSVFNLYLGFPAGSQLSEFAFILRWPKLSRDEKAELYSKYACHELHFFLHEKDPQFFEEVVRPYLANKYDKTFLDRWLLDDDLTEFLDPWRFSQLNVVERILLTQRIEGQAEGGARYIRELNDLIPIDPETQLRLFYKSLAGKALDPQAATSGIRSSWKGDLSQDLKAHPKKARSMRPPAANKPREADKDNEDAVEEAEEKAMELDGFAEEPRDASRDRALERAKSLDVLELRKEAKRLYRAPDRTRRWAEHNYHHLRITEQGPNLVPVNDFWRDLAENGLKTEFYSPHFAAATSNFTEMMFALSFLDLPFEAEQPEIELGDLAIVVKPKSPTLLVRKELRPSVSAEGGLPLLVSQAFFRVGDRYQFVGKERRDKFVKGEFLVGVPYGCRVVLTNPSSTPRKLEVLIQIPQGAIPLQRGSATKGYPQNIGAYGTSTIEFYFYFPTPGTFTLYPVQAARDGKIVAYAESVRMKAVRKLTRVDTSSWEHVSQAGSDEQVMDFIAAANLGRVELERIAWRMKNRAFFERVIAVLRNRHAFDKVLWSYGLFHQDARTTREFLCRHGFVKRCGAWIDSPLLTVDPVERKTYEHIEYSPLFNGRAHRFGRRRRILDEDLARQYTRLMRILGYVPKLTDRDRLAVTYYLLLQDRIEEALSMFDDIDRDRMSGGGIQYDYMRAYLDFYRGNLNDARTLANRYAKHPVRHWRLRFQEVLSQLDEIEGGAVAVTDEGDRGQQQTAAAAAEPSIELRVESRKIMITHQNVSACDVNFFQMDIEFLFSSSPFVQNDSGAFAYVKPNKTIHLELNPEAKLTTIPLPEEYSNDNVLVEVRAGGQVRRQSYYANSLSVRLMENFGQLKVTHAETGERLSKVYVKVFAKKADGTVRFHKDGYTDLRGRFDYASLTGQGSQDARMYAILVLSERDGAVIKEVAPPLQ